MQKIVEIILRILHANIVPMNFLFILVMEIVPKTPPFQIVFTMNPLNHVIYVKKIILM